MPKEHDPFSTYVKFSEKETFRTLWHAHVIPRLSVKKVFLKISQNSQENTCARASFNKVAGLNHKSDFFFSIKLILVHQKFSL